MICKHDNAVCICGKSENDYCPIKPLINEEWFCSLSTEKKAEWITEQINKAVGLALHDAEICDGDVNEDDYMNSADDWVQWLKDVHKE